MSDITIINTKINDINKVKDEINGFQKCYKKYLEQIQSSLTGLNKEVKKLDNSNVENKIYGLISLKLENLI